MSELTRKALQQRLIRLEKFEKNPELKAIALEACRADVITFINDFCVTYDPRCKPSLIPFKLYDYQVDYIHFLRDRYKNGEQGTLMKCRDSGGTFLAIVDSVHHWLFDNDFKALFLSRKEDLVDQKSNPDSIFEKVRMVLRWLPKWMLPKDFDWSKHVPYCKVINPSNGSTIVGEAGGEAGRGGRSAIVHWDETAFSEQDRRIESAISNNANCIIYTSTPNGIGGLYYDKVHNAAIPCFKMEFWQDPRKNNWEKIDKKTGLMIETGKGYHSEANVFSKEIENNSEYLVLYPWLERQKKVLDEIVVQQEILLRFDVAIDGVFIPGDLINTAVGLELPETGEFTINPNKRGITKGAFIPRVKIAALDVATTGKNLSVLGCRQGSSVLWFKDWKNNDPTQLAYKVLEVYENLSESDRWHKLVIDADGVGSGTLSTLAAMPDLPFEIIAFRGGARASELYWEGEEKHSYEKFYNARAESWGIVKWRLKNTFDKIFGIKDCEPDVMISIPEIPVLQSQLSAPKYKYTSDKRILLESKEDMAKRGVGSPDYADCLAYLFAEFDSVNTDWLES